jgi:hypothetical protein
MNYDPAQLTDDQLLGIELRTDDPSAIENLSTNRPLLDGSPTILMEYHLPQSRPAVRCCYCDTKTPHRNGFVIEGAYGRRHLIGSTCGPTHLGLSFNQARTGFKTQVTRQSLLRRIAAMRPALSTIESYHVPTERLRPLLEAEETFRNGAPDLYRDLRQLVVKGQPLSETVRVRDYESEQRSQSEEPKFRSENRSIGQVDGAAFLRARTLSDTLAARRRAVAVFVRTIASGTDKLTERELRQALDALEEADELARTAVSALNRAHAFFTAANFERIERSNLKTANQLPLLDARRFGFRTRNGDVTWYQSPTSPSIPAPPRLTALNISPDRSR